MGRVVKELHKVRRVFFWLLLVCMACGTAFLTVSAGRLAAENGFSPLALALFSPAGSDEEMAIVDLLPQAEMEDRKAAGAFFDPVGQGIGPVQGGGSFFLGDDVILEEKGGSTGVSADAAAEDRVDQRIAELEAEVEKDASQWWRHSVQKGETISGIAKKYGVPTRLVVEANLLEDPDRLKLDQVLLVPKTSQDKAAVIAEHKRIRADEEAQKKAAKPIVFRAYSVVAGDSLWSISAKFDIDVNSILGCNELKNPDFLPPGMKLQIPNQDGIIYVARKGDSLRKIADRYGVYAEAVLAANGVVDEEKLLKAGKLFLPGAKPITVVQDGGGKSGSISTVRKRERGFRWPMSGRINSGFGWRRDPFTGRRDFHPALDIKGPSGRSVAAAKGGRVVYAGWMGGYGRVVVISHGGGYSTLYGHCSRLLVSQGQTVTQGKVIAKCGSTGRSTGSHLHFEVRYNNTPINPRSVLR